MGNFSENVNVSKPKFQQYFLSYLALCINEKYQYNLLYFHGNIKMRRSYGNLTILVINIILSTLIIYNHGSRLINTIDYYIYSKFL